MDNEWLNNYYNRLQSEYQYSLNKKDLLTNWSLTIVVALFTIYFGLYNVVQVVVPWVKFALIVGTLVVLIHFFVNSLLAYGFLKKWREVREKIENYWITNDSELFNQIKKDLQTIDHGRRMTIGLSSVISSQLKAGFLVILLGPVILAIYEVHKAKEFGIGYWIVIIFFIIYISWQLISIHRYDQFKVRQK